MATATDKALQRKAGDTAVMKAGNRGDYSSDMDNYFMDQDNDNAQSDEATKQTKEDKARKAAVAKTGKKDPAEDIGIDSGTARINSLIKRAKTNPDSLSDDEVDEVVKHIQRGAS